MCLEPMTQSNDKMHVQCYKKKTGKKQFVDFLKRVDRRYNDKNIQNIFVVLDNLSVHKSESTKRDIQMLPKNKICISASTSARTQLNRSKMVMVTNAGNQQFHI